MEDEVEYLVRRMTGKDDALCQQVTQLSSITNKLLDLAPKFDLSPEIPFNGVRSFANLSKKFIQLLNQLSNVTPSQSVIKKINCLRQLAPVLLKTAIAVELSTARPYGLEGSDFAAEGKSIDRDILEVVSSLKSEELEPLNISGIRYFFLEPQIRQTLDRYLFPLIPFKLLPTLQALQVIFNEDEMSKFLAHYSLHGTLYDIRKVWGAGDRKSSRLFMKWKTSHFKRVKVIKINVSRSFSTWIVADGQVTPCPPRQGQIKCHLFKPKRCNRQQLILYFHGGGYVALSSKSFEAQLEYTARKLKVAILSVDYRLIPENAFPSPIQDALDAYLAIVNDSDGKFKRKSGGLHPTQIVVSGDSAGGHLAISLCYALNEVQKQVDGQLLMPMSLNVLFPAAQLSLGPTSPARCCVMLDSMLPPSILFNVASACHGLLSEDEKILKGQISKGINTGLHSFIGEILSHEESKVHGYRMIERTMNLIKDPFWNLLIYPDTESLENIPLYVQACEFDPLLDDSIALCRIWKGPVKLEVVKGVMHGFTPFAGFSRACKVGLRCVVDHFQQAFNAANNNHNQLVSN